jgi:glycosyltransferase involved in cell wall biosynthesis
VQPLAAALERLAGDPALRARMGAAGRARAVQRFDEVRNLARCVALLEG